MAARKPLVFDFDDAIWLPRVGGSRVLRALHRESAVQDILRCAAAVIAGNSFLADYAAPFQSQRHHCAEFDRFGGLSARYNQSNVVGWIGSRTTLPYLRPLKPVFETLGIKPRVIASGDPTQLGFDGVPSLATGNGDDGVVAVRYRDRAPAEYALGAR